MKNVKGQKSIIRQDIKKLKEILTEDELNNKSQLIFSKVETDARFIHSSHVLVYWSIKGEVDTHRFINKWHGKKTFYLPAIQDENLIIKRFNGEDKLIKSNKLNLSEPAGIQIKDLSIIDLVIVPGIAFDKNNYRLGRGKAYYDMLLKNISAIKIGVCFDIQLVDELPVEGHDIRMDIIYIG